MFRDIFKNRRFIGVLAFFVLCVAGFLLYIHHEKQKGNERPILTAHYEGPFEADTSEVVDHFKEYEGSPHEAYILSISDNRPAEVTIGWKHYVANGANSASGRGAQRDGNNIYLTIIETIYTGPNASTQEAKEVYGELTVKNLEAGKYIIKRSHDNTELGQLRIHNNTELGQLRIEPDTGYSFIGFYIPDFMIDPIGLNTDEQKGDTYQVKVRLRLKGYYKIGYEPILKIDVERTQDVINIEAWQVIPKKNGQIILDPSGITADQHERKHIDIDLGTFSTGSYTAIINGVEYTFEVLPGTY
ncbi:MAG: hypothetical protein OXU51_12695 [Candidatus Poribacteria bacterium]|nr:hypothetical protein [Candidatus Poribacteria bacterium]